MTHPTPALLSALNVLKVIRHAGCEYPAAQPPLRRLLPRARAQHASRVQAWEARMTAALHGFPPETLLTAAHLLEFEAASVRPPARTPLHAARTLLLALSGAGPGALAA